MAQPIDVDGFRVGNRWVIHPMEGWDAETNGQPSELVYRRWRNFGRSRRQMDLGRGSDGGGARSARQSKPADHSGFDPRWPRAIARGLRRRRIEKKSGTADDLLIGFQLTHSGRFSKPESKTQMAPRILYRHPMLDRKYKSGRRTTRS